VTTTGGPEHSVAEPVTQEHLDGDDIVVVPDATPSRHRRARALMIGAVVVLLAAGVGIAVAVTRDDGKSSTVRTVTPKRPPPTRPSPPPRTPPKKPIARKPPASIAPQTPVSSPPVVPAPPPPPPVAPTQPPVTAPPSYPPSVLQWKATPDALTIKSGGHAALTVHVTNPTDGTVTLPHPLSCAPTLRGPKGHVIGFAVCEEMAQVMNPHDTLTQRYTIYATDTASPDGGALSPGYYTLSVENLFDLKVTVKTGGP
jgi:hypothetical protein